MTDSKPYEFFPVGFAYSPEQSDEIAEVQECEPGRRNSPAHEVAGYLRAMGHPLFKVLPSAPKASIGTPVLNIGAPMTLAAYGQDQGAAALAPAAEATTALAPRPQAPQGDGMDELDRSDLVVPRLYLKQPMTEGEGVDEIRNGWSFLSTDPGDASPERRLAILHLKRKKELKLPRTRAVRDVIVDRVETKFGRRLKLAEQAYSICRSDDRLVPSPHVETPLAPRCEGCVHAEWDKAAKSRDCRDLYELAVVDLDTMQPVIVTWRGSAVREVKKLLTSVQVAKKRHRLTDAHRFEFTYASSEIPGKEGKYYVPKFGRLSPIADPDVIDELEALREAIVGARFAPEAADDDAGGDS